MPSDRGISDNAGISLRLAQAEDIPSLVKLARKTFDDAFSPDNPADLMQAYMNEAFTMEKLNAELLEADSFFLLAVSDGRLSGYARVRQNPEADALLGPGHPELQRFYVDSAYHGKGVANEMMEEVVKRLSGYKWIWLGVWEHNPRAIRFYTRHGFEVFGTHPFQMGDEIQTDLLMRRAL